MAYIQDINISAIKQTTASPSVGFGLPLITGATGMFKNVDILTGESGLNWKSKTRGSAYYVNVVYTDPGTPSATLSVAKTGLGTDVSPIVIAVSLATDANSVVTTRAKDIKAAVEASGTVNPVVSVSYLGQFGTGVVSAVASTSLTATRFLKLNLASQALKYYNSTDPEYLMAAALQSEEIHVSTFCVYDRETLTGSFGSIMNTLIQTENTWYGLLIAERTKTDLQAAGDWAFDNKKFFIGCTSDETALAGRSNNREMYVIYDTPTLYPDAKIMGNLLGREAGAYTAKWKKYTNIPGTAFSATKLNYIRDNDGVTLQEQGGAVFTNEGTTTEKNFYADDRIGMDWLVATMEADFLTLMLNNDKITYDSVGDAKIESVAANRMSLAGRRSIVAAAVTPAELANSYDKLYQYKITVPDRSLQDPIDIAARTKKGIVITYVYAGAVHNMDVKIYATA